MEKDFQGREREDHALVELNEQQTLMVTGACGPAPALLGAAIGAADGFINGNGVSDAARNAVFGAATGFASCMALASTGFVAIGWGLRAAGYQIINGAMSKSLRKRPIYL